MKVKITNARLSFPDLWKAASFNGSEPKFGATFIFPKGGKTEALVADAIEAVATEKWGAKAPGVLRELRGKDRVCIKDGDGKNYDGYEGMSYVTTSSKTRPMVIDRDRSPLTEEDGRPYAGCYVNASIDVWAMDNQYGKRVCASLVGVQFVKDGDAFGGAASASVDEFEDLGMEEEEAPY